MLLEIKGEMTLAELRQTVIEKSLIVEEEYAVRFTRGAKLYINPTNGFGDKVVPRDKTGEEVTKLRSSGPYPCAADEYDL